MASQTFNVGDVLTAAQMNQIGKDSDWITISSFSNGWTAGSVTPQYRKIGNRVFLRGRINPGTNGATAFTLPSSPTNYRPSTTIVVPATNSSVDRIAIQIDSSGNVQSTGSSAAVNTSLDGVIFLTD